ncbi:MAG: hypothetical protein ACL93V_10470 [Candidatus Electrothrix sp. YB6]
MPEERVTIEQVAELLGVEFAPVLGICIRQDNRNHAAVRLGNNEVPSLYRRIFFNSLLSTSFMYVSGVSLRDISDSTYR